MFIPGIVIGEWKTAKSYQSINFWAKIIDSFPFQKNFFLTLSSTLHDITGDKKVVDIFYFMIEKLWKIMKFKNPKIHFYSPFWYLNNRIIEIRLWGNLWIHFSNIYIFPTCVCLCRRDVAEPAGDVWPPRSQVHEACRAEAASLCIQHPRRLGI